MENQKIAIIITAHSLSGAEKRMISLASYLNQNGQPCMIIANRGTKELIEKSKIAGVPIIEEHGIPLPALRAIRLLQRNKLTWKILLNSPAIRFGRSHLNSILRKHNITLAHLAVCPELLWMIDVPTIFEVTSPDSVKNIKKNISAIPSNIILHAVSESVEYRLRALSLTNTTYTAPLAFPNTDPSDYAHPEFSKKENIIVFAHRFHPRKNSLLFAEVAKKFLKAQQGWKILIRGRGAEEEKIKQLLSKEISKNLVEVGYTQNLRHDLNRSKIFISLIEPDNYPSQSVIEAMLAGNALLLSDTGRSKEKFLCDNGIAVELNKDRVLASLIELTRDQDSLKRKASASYSFAKKNYSKEVYRQHIQSIYKQCDN